MKTQLLALAAAMTLSAAANAAPLFTVDEGAVPGALDKEITADKITLRYEAYIDQTAAGTFTESGYFNATGFALGNSNVPSQLGAGLLDFGYDIYGKFSVSGTISFVGTTALATFTTGFVEFWLDENQDTTTSLVGGVTTITDVSPGDDSLLGSSNVVIALSQANVPLVGGQAASGGSFIINYGELDLTALGDLFFVDPVPFYLLVEVSGENESFTPVLTSGDYQGVAQGDASAIFAVPEPASLALFGLGLIGLGATTRRRAK